MKQYRLVNYVFAATIGISLLAQFIPFSTFVNNRIGLLVISQFILIIPSLAYLYVTKQKYSIAVGLKKISFPNVVLLIVFTLCMTPIMTLVNAFSQQYAVDSTTDIMKDIAAKNPFLLSLFCIALIPALFEESVYRGIFYQEYRKLNPFGAIFFSALLFGLLHGNLNQFTYAFVMGVIMAIVIEATDSILSTMVIHFVTNGLSVVLIYALPKLQEKYANLLGESNKVTEVIQVSFLTVLQVYARPAIIGGLIGFVVLRQIAKNSQRLEHMKELFRHRTKEEKLSRPPIRSLLTVPLIISIVICTFNIIFNEIYIR